MSDNSKDVLMLSKVLVWILVWAVISVEADS